MSNEIIKFLNINLKDLTDTQISQISVLTSYMTNVCIPEQNLTKEEYARILRLWGHNPKRNFWFEDKKNHEVMYVTNRKITKNGQQGLFARGELEWHCNGVLAEDPEDVVTLYCETPTKDPCNTQFLNSVPAYNDLPKDVKKQIKDTQCILSSDDRRFHKLKMPHLIKTKLKPKLLGDINVYKVDKDIVPVEEQDNLQASYSRSRSMSSSIKQEMMQKKLKYNNEKALWNCVYKKLVHQHRLSGVTGLYFPMYNIIGFHDIPEDEWKDLYNFLKTHYVKYKYSHEWKTGDLILFDNTVGIHKRDMIPLDKNGQPQDRSLWRGAFWYKDIQ